MEKPAKPRRATWHGALELMREVGDHQIRYESSQAKPRNPGSPQSIATSTPRPLCQDQVRHQGQPLLVELEG